MNDKYYTYEEALKKMQAFCAYQDRCHQEVRNKLLEMKVYGDKLEEIVGELISENFLNEERFACSFAGGKFRIKKWGRSKIVRELKSRQVSEYSIKKALQKEISPEDYQKTLFEVLEKKAALLGKKLNPAMRQKLAIYAIGRGFEAHLVWESIAEIWGKSDRE